LKDRNRHRPARLLCPQNARSRRAELVMTLIGATSQSRGGGRLATPASGRDLTDLSHDAQIRGHHGVWDARMTRSGSSRQNSGHYAFSKSRPCQIPNSVIDSVPTAGNKVTFHIDAPDNRIPIRMSAARSRNRSRAPRPLSLTGSVRVSQSHPASCRAGMCVRTCFVSPRSTEMPRRRASRSHLVLQAHGRLLASACSSPAARAR
jgi:hypothetical protein